MKFYQKLLAATALVALMSGAASAKTFVYCSPASPEGFDPAAYTGGDTFDASIFASSSSVRRLSVSVDKSGFSFFGS